MIITEKEINADFVVAGGGMAGLCAAVAAARNGLKTVIIQDRPMFGGNASSEVRMWICGAHGKNRKETGLLEELQLANCYYNPLLKYTIWDHVMYNFAIAEKNLTVLLNTTVKEVKTENKKITSIVAWNLVEYANYNINGKIFADCSGDGIMRLSGANYRSGREAKLEFNEPHAPEKADKFTMGNSILMQLRKTATHQAYRPFPCAYKFTEKNLPPRNFMPTSWNNFWWIEFGGVKDTIKDADLIREELYKIAYGVWDFMKNNPDQRCKDWELDWIGTLPGKRENIRFEGAHTLCQKEVEDEGKFSDNVCYGGWSMDDHHPEAFYYNGPPTIFHPAPSPFGIPFRSLYSANIENLLFAGRHISVTHMAQSSVRVMGTTATMGQAIGTAAALAIKYNTTPQGVYEQHIEELQQILLDQDQFIPTCTREISQLSKIGTPSNEILRDGFDRDWDDGLHAINLAKNENCNYIFDEVVRVSGVRVVLDSDLSALKQQRNIEEEVYHDMPKTLIRNFRIDILKPNGTMETVASAKDNHQRLVKLNWEPKEAKAVYFVNELGWSTEISQRVFSLDII